MKALIGLILLVITATIIAPGWADYALCEGTGVSCFTVAVCNSSLVLQAGQKAMAAELVDLQTEVAARNEKIATMQKEMDGTKKKKGKAYKAKGKELAVLKEVNADWMRQTNITVNTKLRDMARAAIAKVAKDKGVNLVLDKNVLYADESLDITNAVVNELNPGAKVREKSE